MLYFKLLKAYDPKKNNPSILILAVIGIFKKNKTHDKTIYKLGSLLLSPVPFKNFLMNVMK